MNENPAKCLRVLNKEMSRLKWYGGEIYPLKKIMKPGKQIQLKLSYVEE